MKLQKQAFTLVELIVVITILAVLSTIWFVSYSWYLAWTRDTNRISQLKSISDWLHLFSTNHTLPSPDDNIDVKANSEVIATQWYAWKNTLETITYSTSGLDPKDKIYFSYYLTRDKKYFQLMTFLEEEDSLQTAWIFNNTKAVDYSIRYPAVFWDKLWILTDEFNVPVQEIAELKSAKLIDLWWTNSWTIYSAHINDGRTYTFTWRILNHKLYTISKPWKYWPPKDCPDWFIAAWWDSAFNQLWFCVAKYEMSYEDATTAESPGGFSTNTVWFVVWKPVVSKTWRYPISMIKWWEAAVACMSMWKWYHLIMNSEWMSLARQIELEKENWSGGEVLNGFIYNWVSRDTNMWCDETWWNIEDYTFETRTWPWNNSCDSKRQLTLYNYQKIWDLAWNINEFTNKANTLDWTWVSSWTTTINSYEDLTSDGFDDNWVYDISDMDKYGSIFYLWKTNGMWTIQEEWVANNVFVRWASVWDRNNTWIFSITLWADENHKIDFKWFRCAYMK